MKILPPTRDLLNPTTKISRQSLPPPACSRQNPPEEPIAFCHWSPLRGVRMHTSLLFFSQFQGLPDMSNSWLFIAPNFPQAVTSLLWHSSLPWAAHGNQFPHCPPSYIPQRYNPPLSCYFPSQLLPEEPAITAGENTEEVREGEDATEAKKWARTHTEERCPIPQLSFLLSLGFVYTHYIIFPLIGSNFPKRLDEIIVSEKTTPQLTESLPT